MSLVQEKVKYGKMMMRMCFLINPQWKILSSIACVKGKSPCVFTFNENTGGKKLFVVHPCQCKNNLTLKRTDQICQAVIQPGILNPMKASK